MKHQLIDLMPVLRRPVESAPTSGRFGYTVGDGRCRLKAYARTTPSEIPLPPISGLLCYKDLRVFPSQINKHRLPQNEP